MSCACAECALHVSVPVPVPSVRRLRAAVTSSLLRDHERLERKVGDLELKIKALENHALRRAHFVEIICDRCRASLSIASSMPLHGATTSLLEQAARESRWGLIPSQDTHLCPACSAP